MSAAEHPLLNVLRGAATRSGLRRFVMRVGNIKVLTRAHNEAEATERVKALHARHVAALSKTGLTLGPVAA